MLKLPFIEEITEGRIFNDGSSLKQKTAKEIAEIVMLMTLALEILRFEDESAARKYANDTLKYNSFNGMAASCTDYHNLISVLANQEKYSEKMELDKSVGIPELQLKTYLRGIINNINHHLLDRSFLLTLEEYLKTSKYKLYRRVVGDWKQASPTEKSTILALLRREFNNKAIQSDLYQVFKHEIKL